MARIDRRLRLWAWIAQRQAAATVQGEDAALRAAGVPVRLTEYVGMPHGYLNFPGLCRLAPQALAEITAEQRLVQPPGPGG
jgi:acetyl esterase/lipase